MAKTGHYGRVELDLLRLMSAGDLASALLSLDEPLGALRSLAEVMLNRDDAKLEMLLANDELRKLWEAYASDEDVDERDHEYARQLRTRLT